MLIRVRKTVILFCVVLVSALLAGTVLYADEPDDLSGVQGESQVYDLNDDGEPVVCDEAGFEVSDTDGAGSQAVDSEDLVTADATPAITIKKIKADQEYEIRLTGVTTSYTSVLFYIWSDFNGQDDLIGNKAAKQTDGSYKFVMKIADYKHIGLFHVHTYGVDSANKKTFIKAKDFETTYPKGGKVSISKSNYSKGTFTVTVDSMVNPGSAKKITAKVWSKSDKSDAKTFTLTKQSDGTWGVNISLASFGMNDGVYQAEVTSTDKLGDKRTVGKTSVNMKSVHKVTFKSLGHDGLIKATISGLKYPGGINKVYLPTWSLTKGQDDIYWYLPSKDSSGNWTVTIKLANHKHLGKYQSVLYIRDSKDKLRSLEKATFSYLVPEGGTTSVSGVNRTAGTFDVKVSGIKNAALVKNVRVPVWCKKDQSDIKWYTAARQSDGSYKASVNIKDHKYSTGTYQVHSYATDIKGDLRMLSKSTCAMTGSASSFAVKGVSGKPASRLITVGGVVVPGGVKSVQIAVWSVNDGQDDLKWYQAPLQSGQYAATVDLLGHKSTGTFNAHVYGKTMGGGLCILARKTFSVSGSATGKVTASSVDGTKGTFVVTGSSLSSGQKISAVYYDVYSQADRSDRYQYAGTLTDGAYKATVNVKNHKYHFGTYTVELLAQLENGACVPAGKTTCKITASKYIYVTRISDSQVKVTLVDPSYSNTSSVLFPTWSSTGGQDDLIWYNGSKNSDGTWSAVISGINHLHAGTFNTHVYAKDSAANTTKLGQKTYTLTFSTGFTGRRLGVDVSHWNDRIDWTKVKNAGIKYAIIRCGYGRNSKDQDDREWARNVAECERLGIPYGAYIYSHAKTEAEALDEAKHCLRLLKGHYPKYPVYLDLEDPNDTAPLSNAMLAKISKKFCDTIKANGYKAGVYSSTSWWETKLTGNVYNSYSKWVAQWASRCYYTGKYDMWQFTSTGKVNGISGDVDLNYAY